MAGDSSLEGSTTLASGQPHPPKQLLPTNEPLKILDVGCGGGLACESLARIFQTAHRVTRDEGHTGAGGSSDRTDAEVTKHDVDDSGDTVVVVGIDPSPDLLEVARSHALLDPLRTGCIQYHNMSVEEYAEKFWNQQEQRHQQQGEEMNEEKHQHKDGGARVLDGPFDAICLLEVVEHVEDAALLDSMLTSLAGLLKEGGLLFVSTLNRTWKSHLLTIVGAEYVMGYLPVGTHRFDLYKSPDEIRSILVRHGLRQLDAAGMVPTSVPIPLSPPSWLIPKTLAPITGPDAPPPPLLPLALLRSMLPSPSWEWKLDPRDTNVNWIGTYQKQSIAAFESE
jgi:2-polyprenyl-3-methyl-5-hydroxy-6-metoxy-1,4-benzoquinol methylase